MKKLIFAGLIAISPIIPLTASRLDTPLPQTTHYEESLTADDGMQTPESALSMFKIEAQGIQPLKIKKMQFEISGSYNVNAGYGPFGFAVNRVDTETGEEAPDDALGGLSPYLVYTKSINGHTFGNAVVNGATAAGQTIIPIGTTNGAASSSTIVTGDSLRVTFTGDVNDGAGYKILAADPTSLTITPALQNGIADDATITILDTTDPGTTDNLGSRSILESGAVIGFNLSEDPDIISPGTAKGYVVTANTTRIKDNRSATTASTTVRMLGARATNDSSNGLTWYYTRTTGVDTTDLTLSDSYIVTGQTFIYR